MDLGVRIDSLRKYSSVEELFEKLEPFYKELIDVVKAGKVNLADLEYFNLDGGVCDFVGDEIGLCEKRKEYYDIVYSIVEKGYYKGEETVIFNKFYKDKEVPAIMAECLGVRLEFIEKALKLIESRKKTRQ